MKANLLIISFLCITIFSFGQNIIRVQNGQNIQTLINENPAGSVFLLDPGNYAGFNTTRRISVIGAGYFNGTNESNITSQVTFSASSSPVSSSAGSIITGCNVFDININVSNVVVSRNRVHYYAGGITIADNTSGVIVKQCFVLNDIATSGDPTSFQIINNIVVGQIYLYNNGAALSGIITNNVVLGENITDCRPLIISNTTNNGVVISNNIFISASTCTNNLFPTNFLGGFHNNVFRQGTYQTANTSNTQLTQNNLLTTLFQNQGNVDAFYRLSATSPAKLVGTGGTDCGAFGGNEPYILSGLPTGPIIYELKVPSTARQNEIIPVRIKARVQN